MDTALGTVLNRKKQQIIAQKPHDFLYTLCNIEINMIIPIFSRIFIILHAFIGKKHEKTPDYYNNIIRLLLFVYTFLFSHHRTHNRSVVLGWYIGFLVGIDFRFSVFFSSWFYFSKYRDIGSV